jgi:hypothetical protein
MFITVGPFKIEITFRGKLVITHAGGESGEFSMDRFVAHIQEFWNKEF